jgi:hypothetical protein
MGIPDEDFVDDSIHPGWKRKIADYFKNKSNKAKYIYDYGDDSEHSIMLEKILSREEANTLCIPEGQEHVHRRI